jgi:hypothetical protein
MTDLAKLVVRLEAEIGKYQDNLEKAEKQLHRFADNSEHILAHFGDAVAAYFTIDAAVEWGKHILENGDHLAKFSQSTGIAVEQLSALQYGLKSSGVEGEAAGRILKELNNHISDAAGNAQGEAAAAFKSMGLSVKDAQGHLKDAGTELGDIADKFKNYEDGANKSALATALLGKFGAQAIPFLNQGADGIARLSEEAGKLGAVISGDTAKAAEEFNDRLFRMKTLVVDGIGNTIAKILLPTLNDLGDQLEEDVGSVESLNHVAEICATGLKLLASAGLIVGKIFDVVGETIGAGVAVNLQLLQGNFSQAYSIAKDFYGRQSDDAAKFQKRLAGIWNEGGDDVLRTVKVHAQRMREEAPNLAATKEIEKAAEESLKKLKEFEQQLAEQVKTFGLGEAEAVKYRVTIGNLSDEVTKAGAAGLKMRDAIIADAAALQKLKDTKEITKALGEVQAQIEALRGNSADAAIAAFDAKNAELVTKLRREGDTAGQHQLDTLLSLIVAQADYNELNQKASKIEQDLAIQEERLNNSRAAGALTDLELQQQLGTAREKAARQLEDIYAQQKKIADQTGNKEQQENLQRFGQNIENLKSQVDLVGQAFRKTFEDSFADELAKAEKGTESLGEAFKNLLDGLADQLLKLANQQIAQQLIGAIAGSGTTGGGYLSSILGAFGGGRAAGGPVLAGHMYTINEGTPDRESFVAPTNGRIERAGGDRTMSVQQTFVLQTERGGTVPRQTQLQVGAQAAKGLADAQRRNG